MLLIYIVPTKDVVRSKREFNKGSSPNSLLGGPF